MLVSCKCDLQELLYGWDGWGRWLWSSGQPFLLLLHHLFVFVCLLTFCLPVCNKLLHQLVVAIISREKMTCLGSYTLSCDILKVQGDHHWGAWDSLTESDIKWQIQLQQWNSSRGFRRRSHAVNPSLSNHLSNPLFSYNTLAAPSLSLSLHLSSSPNQRKTSGPWGAPALWWQQPEKAPSYKRISFLTPVSISSKEMWLFFM